MNVIRSDWESVADSDALREILISNYTRVPLTAFVQRRAQNARDLKRLFPHLAKARDDSIVRVDRHGNSEDHPDAGASAQLWAGCTLVIQSKLPWEVLNHLKFSGVILHCEYCDEGVRPVEFDNFPDRGMYCNVRWWSDEKGRTHLGTAHRLMSAAIARLVYRSQSAHLRNSFTEAVKDFLPTLQHEQLFVKTMAPLLMEQQLSLNALADDYVVHKRSLTAVKEVICAIQRCDWC